MHRVILALLLLGACAAPAPTVTGLRDPAVPVYSIAAFAPDSLVGRWQQVAALTAQASPGCPPGGAEFSQTPKGTTLAARLCVNGKVLRLSGPVTPAGPGRFQLPGLGEAWVIWSDTDNRTLAIASPSGAWGFVLDKGRISPDRFAAAAEIFAFNGYRTGALKPF